MCVLDEENQFGDDHLDKLISLYVISDFVSQRTEQIRITDGANGWIHSVRIGCKRYIRHC